MIRGASLLSKDMSIMEEDTTLSAETAEVITRGAFRCMALHKKGLYIGGEVRALLKLYCTVQLQSYNHLPTILISYNFHKCL